MNTTLIEAKIESARGGIPKAQRFIYKKYVIQKNVGDLEWEIYSPKGRWIDSAADPQDAVEIVGAEIIRTRDFCIFGR